MTPREADLYRWFEVFTIDPREDAENPFYLLALSRKYIQRKRGGEVVVTDAGWEWFAVRCSQIIARCEAGFHLMKPKTTFGDSLHCVWCGECAEKPCPECRAFFLGGTIEGGCKEPLSPTSDSPQYSSITHGKGKE